MGNSLRSWALTSKAEQEANGGKLVDHPEGSPVDLGWVYSGVGLLAGLMIIGGAVFPALGLVFVLIVVGTLLNLFRAFGSRHFTENNQPPIDYEWHEQYGPHAGPNAFHDFRERQPWGSAGMAGAFEVDAALSKDSRNNRPFFEE